MSGYLLVPTNVQAFLVGKTADPDTDPLYDLAPVPRTKDDLVNWYGDSKYSFSFQASKFESPLQPGVHLHWALPDALMHARHEGGKKPEQPCIPNRWLVLRMRHADGDSKISAKAWVVESDYVSDDANSERVPFIFVKSSVDNPSVDLKYVGRALPLGGWQETHEAFELKSFGWGDPSFAAYYPACKSVLGFHDKMEKVNSGDLLTYLVIGWYSEPSKDPLTLNPPVWQSNHRYEVGDIVTPTKPNGRQYRVTSAGTSDSLEPSWPIKGTVTNGKVEFEVYDLLASLGWSCSSLGEAVLPQQTLCHGGVVGIKWQGPDQKYPAASPGTTPATVAIGGSAAEAIAALLDQKKDKSLQQVLCAFQHGQATEVSDYYQLGELLHRHSFSAVPGGTCWSIEPIARSADPMSTLPPVSPNIQKLLGDLNQAQRALDQHTREIESLRWRLFACWATWASGTSERTVVDPADTAMQTATSDLYQNDVNVRKKSVTNALTAEKNAGMQLAESTMPPFLYPKDPFVIVKGDNLGGIDRTRAQRPDQDAAGALRCRLAKEVVTGVSQSGTIIQPWEAAKCFKLDFPDKARVPFGEVAGTLALETLLFDPNCAALIETGDAKVRDLFKTLQESLDPTRTSYTNTLTWTGQPPDPLGITRWGGSNPWLPVYLMWQADWAPAYAPAQGSDNSHSNALGGWRLDSDPLAGDLVPQSKAPAQSTDKAFLEGVTIISAVSGSQLAENLRKFAETTVHNTNNVQSIEQTHVLAQSLGGFNDLLLRQTLGLCLPPVDPTSKKVDAAIWEAIARAPHPTMPIDRDYFFPVRAGALRLVNLYIVDTFGETRKLVDSAGSMAQMPTIISSVALPPPPLDYHASFSPRLVQPARLNFDWQPADSAASGPVCGWIVANFLEKSFAVFSASGAPLGALESVLPALGEKTIKSNVTFHWRPIPGSTLAVEKIGNQRLQNFVGLVTTFTADEGQAFLELVDLVLRRTEARVPAEDPAMAVLLGRPLALVQASLDLEIQGLPAGYWKTDGDALKFETEDFEKLSVPVRLGGMSLPSDGLVGYLLKNGDCFFASEGATRRLGKNSHINYDQALTVAFKPTPTPTPKPTPTPTDNPPSSLTLLMDASARVHATTGILPRHFIQLPPEAAKQLDLIRDFYFNVAPVLGARPQTDSAKVIMPRPSDAFGQWSWATRPSLVWNEIKPADDRARFADGLALSEGWLKLRVKGDNGEAPPGNRR